MIAFAQGTKRDAPIIKMNRSGGLTLERAMERIISWCVTGRRDANLPLQNRGLFTCLFDHLIECGLNQTSTKEPYMGRHLLMQSLLGHLALLAEKHPKKASSALARKVKLEATQVVRPRREATRRAA